MSSSKRNKSPEASIFTIEQIKGFTDFDTTIAEGGNSKIYKGQVERKDVAVKVYTDNRRCRLQWDKEIQYLQRFKHQNIIRLIGYGEGEQMLVLVLDYLPKTLTSHFIGLNWPDTLKVIKQSALALKCINEHGLIFADFKTDNILLDQDDNIKLIDFGSVEKAGKMIMTYTPGYSAPEINFSGKGDLKSDIYSFGVVMLQLLMKIDDVGTPQGKKTPTSSQKQKKTKEEKDFHIGIRATSQAGKRGDVVHDELKKTGCDPALAGSISALALQCIEDTPKKRPSFEELISQLNTL